MNLQETITFVNDEVNLIVFIYCTETNDIYLVSYC